MPYIVSLYAFATDCELSAYPAPHFWLSVFWVRGIQEQLLREGKPIGDTFIWYDKYNKYLNLMSKFTKNIDPFLEIEGLQDLRDELKDIKTRLVETAPFGSVKPDFESIIRILKGVEVDIELYEDLYSDVKRFLTRYELCQNLISV